MNKLTSAIFLLAVLSLSLSPADIWFSSIFYDAANGGFYLKDYFLFKFLRKGFPEIMGFFAGIVIIIGIINYFRKKTFLNISIKESLFLALSLATAPGLIINSFLKEFSGRARPSQIDIFGGDKIFSPAYMFSNQCESNCSFASGHASFAFWLTALAMIAPLKYQKKLFVFFIIIGVLVSFTRIVQGGHFLSDVVFAGMISLFVNFMIYKLIYKKDFIVL